MQKSFFIILLTFLGLFGCSEEDKVAREIQNIDLEVNVDRFDIAFSEARPQDIPTLKAKYPYLFPSQYPDSVWSNKLVDTLQVELSAEVKKAFPNFKAEKRALELLFKHITYYFPKYNVPKVITVTSNVDYTNRVILADSLLLIGLDSYLGKKHRFYQDFQRYVAKQLDAQYIVSDVAGKFAEKVVAQDRNDRTFLAQMIYFGKILYIKDKITPFLSDAQKIGYDKEQLAWAKANEEAIWRNFIEQEHLYSTNNRLSLRFLDIAPFSKFGLELDNESPGRIGQYIGWQIVRAFMEKNKISLDRLLRLSAEDIFKRSTYKPRK